ncbi:MAG: hypothetical protein FD167_408 [bacterium]|nr:MAG: hypothetical protein FD167_408 [bacterium]
MWRILHESLPTPKLWQEKLIHFETALAVTSDPTQQFGKVCPNPRKVLQVGNGIKVKRLSKCKTRD